MNKRPIDVNETVWFYDGANRLMQGKVLERTNCDNGHMYYIQSSQKGFWLQNYEIFRSHKEALLLVGCQ
jgi:hypothetical protein